MRNRRMLGWLGGLIGLIMGSTVSLGAKDWRVAHSPHFDLYSLARPGESQELLAHLELFRSVFVRELDLPTAGGRRTTVVLFRHHEDFDPFKPQVNGKPASLGGYCINHPDGSFIALAIDGDNAWARRAILHEYVHKLLADAGRELPPWLNEGLAEAYSTMEFSRGELVLGKSIPEHVVYLRQQGLMPLPRLFSVGLESADYTEESKQGLFYAQAWLLAHYCSFGRDGLPRAALLDFARRMAEAPNGSLHAAFRDCFGMELDEMEQRLSEYVNNGRYHSLRQPEPADWPGKSNRWERADTLSVELVLLQLRARAVRDPAAAYAARQLQVAHPDDPRPFELLAAVALMNDQTDLALDYWRSAAERNSTNGFVQMATVEKTLGTWLDGARLDQAVQAPMAQELRQQLERARGCNLVAYIDDYWTLWLEAFAETPVLDRVDGIRQRLESYPRAKEMRLALAVLAHRTGHPTEARSLVEALVAAPPLLRGELLEQLAAIYGIVYKAPATLRPGLQMKLAAP